MGIIASKDRTIDEACSNTSLSKFRYVAVEKPKWKVFSKRDLSKFRYVAVEKPKWKVFSKREIRKIPAYSMRGKKGCHCGSNGPCKERITPQGNCMHYPNKYSSKKSKRYKLPKVDKAFLNDKDRVVNKVKIVRPKKFPIPTWIVDKMSLVTPFLERKNHGSKKQAKEEPESQGEDDEDEED